MANPQCYNWTMSTFLFRIDPHNHISAFNCDCSYKYVHRTSTVTKGYNIVIDLSRMGIWLVVDTILCVTWVQWRWVTWTVYNLTQIIAQTMEKQYAWPKPAQLTNMPSPTVLYHVLILTSRWLALETLFCN